MIDPAERFLSLFADMADSAGTDKATVTTKTFKVVRIRWCPAWRDGRQVLVPVEIWPVPKTHMWDPPTTQGGR